MFVTPPAMLGWETLGGPSWCPTLQLEVQFKRPPTGKKVLSSIVARHIINSRFDCEGGIWDEDGNLLAITRYVYELYRLTDKSNSNNLVILDTSA